MLSLSIHVHAHEPSNDIQLRYIFKHLAETPQQLCHIFTVDPPANRHLSGFSYADLYILAHVYMITDPVCLLVRLIDEENPYEKCLSLFRLQNEPD